MVTRLMEMVSFILSRTFEGDDENWGDVRQRIGEVLETHGFHPAEIVVALDVVTHIRSRLKEEDYPDLPLHTNRIYQYLEEVRLTTEARGYLLGLLHERIITPIEYQQIVERSLLLDTSEVGVEEIRFLTQSILKPNTDLDAGDEDGGAQVLH
ncbi:MAG TPA: DUF494 family protein [bacterium]|nr:DUF494 family protein [bacterium]HQO35759.1 DUF494 family protein [bacterium]HQQ01049.1 DUF494 family protein [bacterium]